MSETDQTAKAGALPVGASPILPPYTVELYHPDKGRGLSTTYVALCGGTTEEQVKRFPLTRGLEPWWEPVRSHRLHLVHYGVAPVKQADGTTQAYTASPQARADLAFIATACNAHQPLLGALWDAVATLRAAALHEEAARVEQAIEDALAGVVLP